MNYISTLIPFFEGQSLHYIRCESQENLEQVGNLKNAIPIRPLASRTNSEYGDVQ